MNVKIAINFYKIYFLRILFILIKTSNFQKIVASWWYIRDTEGYTLYFTFSIPVVPNHSSP
jgi:hypothetical protein